MGGWDTTENYVKGMTRAEYAPYMHKFNPVKFNPDAWLELAEAAGMGYITFTTKHTDGFCMWNTRETRYNIMNTPYGNDTLKIPEEAASLLRQIGKWYKSVKESLLDVDAAGMMTRNRNVLLTQRGATLYVHLFKEQETPAVYPTPIATLPRRATLLNTGERIECEVMAPPRLALQKPNRCLRLKNLPVSGPTSAGLVVKLEFEHLDA